MPMLQVLTAEERAKFVPVPSNLKRGEASFHHPLTIHGSFANKSGRYRRAAVINYFADGNDVAGELPRHLSAASEKCRVDDPQARFRTLMRSCWRV